MGVSKRVNSHIQALVRVEKTVGKQFVNKVLMECANGLNLNIGQMYWLPVTNSLHVANLLAYVWKSNTAINGTKFSKSQYSEENVENGQTKRHKKA